MLNRSLLGWIFSNGSPPFFFPPSSTSMTPNSKKILQTYVDYILDDISERIVIGSIGSWITSYRSLIIRPGCRVIRVPSFLVDKYFSFPRFETRNQGQTLLLYRKGKVGVCVRGGGTWFWSRFLGKSPVELSSAKWPVRREVVLQGSVNR